MGIKIITDWEGQKNPSEKFSGDRKWESQWGNQVADRKFALDLDITVLFMAVRTIFLGRVGVWPTARLECTCASQSVWSSGQECQYHLGSTVKVGPTWGGSCQALWSFLMNAQIGHHSNTHGETVLELKSRPLLTSRLLSCFPSVSKCSLPGNGFEYVVCARFPALCWEHKEIGHTAGPLDSHLDSHRLIRVGSILTPLCPRLVICKCLCDNTLLGQL